LADPWVVEVAGQVAVGLDELEGAAEGEAVIAYLPVEVVAHDGDGDAAVFNVQSGSYRFVVR